MHRHQQQTRLRPGVCQAGSLRFVGPAFIRSWSVRDLGAYEARGIKDAFKVRAQISMSRKPALAAGKGNGALSEFGDNDLISDLMGFAERKI